MREEIADIRKESLVEDVDLSDGTISIVHLPFPPLTDLLEGSTFCGAVNGQPSCMPPIVSSVVALFTSSIVWNAERPMSMIVMGTRIIVVSNQYK